MSASAAPVIFYVNKTEEIVIDTISSATTATYLVAAPMYFDSLCTKLVGTLGIRKSVNNLVNGQVTPTSVAVYDYECFWDLPQYVSGISAFSINVGNSILGNGSTEVPGVYRGGLDGVRSSGTFLNYGGEVQKTKDLTPVRQYILGYYPLTNYNTLGN